MVPEITDALLVTRIKDEKLLRILRELGLRSYLAVPLRARDKTVGVITFVSAEAGRRYDANDLAVAEDLAHRATIALENTRLYGELREANRHKDEFLAMLAHELRNPLAPMRNGLQILKSPEADLSMLDRARTMLERQVGHMTRIVDDLLDVSRITRGKIVLRKERLDLGRIVRHVVEDERPAFQRAGLAAHVELPETPVWVTADATRMTQVLEYLLQNAIKFTNQGGSVFVGVRADADHQQAVLVVRDTGIGIEADMLPHLFETFAQADRSLERSRGGLGLGLALVQGLVKLHGGEVQATSAGSGTGAEFTVRLPLEPEPAALATVPTAPHRPTEHLQILVIEDNRDAADSLRMLLELNGYEVTVAYSGPEGVRAAERCHPQVVLCDIGLPGLNGYGVAEELRRKLATAQPRLIAVTGYSAEDDLRRSQAVGFDAHLVKPVDPNVLLGLLAIDGSPHPPAVASGHDKPEPSPPSFSREEGSHRVLIVDDNVDAADSLAMLLRLQGQDVQVAHDGPSALEMAAAYRPEIVFLDIGLPGMDGYEVCRQLRQQPGMDKVRLIALTGWGQEEDRRRSREAGFDEHLVKPVDPAALEELLVGLQVRTG
jgi:signal transduction histidine kinase/DNA-binding response OmpR family regulator